MQSPSPLVPACPLPIHASCVLIPFPQAEFLFLPRFHRSVTHTCPCQNHQLVTRCGSELSDLDPSNTWFFWLTQINSQTASWLVYPFLVDLGLPTLKYRRLRVIWWDMPAHCNTPMHKCISHCLPATTGECARPEHAADEYIHHCEGWQDGDAAFCQITLVTCYYMCNFISDFKIILQLYLTVKLVF